MTRLEVYDAFHMVDEGALDRQFVGFTLRSMQQVGGAEIRRQMDTLGYDSARIVISDSELTTRYTEFVIDASDRITRGYNAYLESFVKTLPEDVTVAQAKADSLLQPFFDSVREHNVSTLIPYISDTARSWARNAFYDRNNSPATGKTLTESVDWDWNQASDYDDDCTAAAAASPAPRDQLEAIAGGPAPAHPNCDCEEAPRELSPDDLPAQDDLWTGDAA